MASIKCYPKNNLETILPQKTGHKCIGTTLPRLKITSRHLELSYRILKIKFFILLRRVQHLVLKSLKSETTHGLVGT